MTLDEFQQKLLTVSDRRLLRMLERAQSEGLAPAVELIVAEQTRRAFIPPGIQPSASPSRPEKTAAKPEGNEDLTSQIRPLEEVLGRNFEWGLEKKSPITKGDSSHEIKLEAFLPEKTLKVDFPDPAPQAHPEPEEMAPLTLTSEDWQQPHSWEPIPPKGAALNPNAIGLSAPEKPSKSRALIIVAIMMLFIAGCLAVWRALVG